MHVPLTVTVGGPLSVLLAEMVIVSAVAVVAHAAPRVTVSVGATRSIWNVVLALAELKFRSKPLADAVTVHAVVPAGTTYVPLYAVSWPVGDIATVVFEMHVPVSDTVGAVHNVVVDVTLNVTVVPAAASAGLAVMFITMPPRWIWKLELPVRAVPVVLVPLALTCTVQSAETAGTVYEPE